MCTGGEGDRCKVPLPGISQGPLYSLAAAAAFETAETNVRFNEVYLDLWVKTDISKFEGAMASSVFADNYVEVLSRTDVKSSRIFVTKESEVKNFRFEKKGARAGSS